MPRHLLDHCVETHARGIERGAIVGRPQVIQDSVALVWRHRRRRAEHELSFAPGGGADRRCDQPVHAGEPIDEERHRAPQREVKRLEPGDEQRLPIDLAGPETQECVHLVNVAPHVADVIVQARDGRVGEIGKERALAPHRPPEHVIEQCEAVDRAMADRVAQQFAIGARDVEGVRGAASRVSAGTTRADRRRRMQPRAATDCSEMHRRRRFAEFRLVRVVSHSHGVHGSPEQRQLQRLACELATKMRVIQQRARAPIERHDERPRPRERAR